MRDGFSRDDIYEDILLNGADGGTAWVMGSHDGSLRGNGKADSDVAGTIKAGKVLTMQVDSEAGTLKFWRGGKPHGPGWASGVTGPLRWAVTLFYHSQRTPDPSGKVTIVPDPVLKEEGSEESSSSEEEEGADIGSLQSSRARSSATNPTASLRDIAGEDFIKRSERERERESENESESESESEGEREWCDVECHEYVRKGRCAGCRRHYCLGCNLSLCAACEAHYCEGCRKMKHCDFCSQYFCDTSRCKGGQLITYGPDTAISSQPPEFGRNWDVQWHKACKKCRERRRLG